VSYTALSPETALAESLATSRYFRLPVSESLPRLIVALDARFSRVLDLTDGKVRTRLQLSLAKIRADWRRENRHKREALTQAWGWAIEAAGYDAALVPSTADSPKGRNLVVFPANISLFKVKNEAVWPT